MLPLAQWRNEAIQSQFSHNSVTTLPSFVCFIAILRINENSP